METIRVELLADALEEHTASTGDKVESNIMDKHTLYAVGWGIIKLPEYNAPEGVGSLESQSIARRRIEIKKACRAYAAARGFNLLLDSYEFRGVERWYVSHVEPIDGVIPLMPPQIFNGTLEDCCRFIMEKEIWPDGKPEDTDKD